MQPASSLAATTHKRPEPSLAIVVTIGANIDAPRMAEIMAGHTPTV